MGGDVIGSFKRLERDGETQRVPVPVAGQAGHFDTDAGWGTIQPQVLHPEIATIGELELIAHLDAGGALVDTRRPEVAARGTIRGARVLSHHDLPGREGEIDRTALTVLFCNGPQCAATPDAVRILLAAGHPPSRLAYYRGGIHDWVTLGLPLEPPG
jgi:rhodanese-related sulfurtransferase